MLLADRIVLTEGIHKAEYALAEQNTRLAKQLYNAALFRIRQVFTGWGKTVRTENEEIVFSELACLRAAYPELPVRQVLSYKVLEKLMRVTENPDFFAGLPMQSAQAVLKSAVQDFGNWLASLKMYRKEPEKFLGKPRMPHYCKTERKTFTITNQDAVLYPVYKDAASDTCGRTPGRHYAGRELKLPGIRHRMFLPHLPEDARLREVKVRPYYGKFLLILTLEVSRLPAQRALPHAAGIDLGTDNIAAIVTTDGASRVYKGGAVLAGNRLFHRERAKAVRALTRGTERRHVSSRHLDRLSEKHGSFVQDMMHKISTDIVRFCIEHGAGTIVIGTNPLWKQGAGMGTRNNQNFESVPHAVLRWMITYKAQNAGITVVCQEESYTSKADVTSGDPMPVFGKTDTGAACFSGKRVGRGLYRCRDGSLINADCNGAANILRKAVPDAWKGRTDYTFLAHPESKGFQSLNRKRAAA